MQSVLWDQEVHKVSGVISDLKEIPEILGLRANRAFPGLRVPPDLKVNKEYKDPKGISGLRVKKVKLGLKRTGHSGPQRR